MALDEPGEMDLGNSINEVLLYASSILDKKSGYMRNNDKFSFSPDVSLVSRSKLFMRHSRAIKRKNIGGRSNGRRHRSISPFEAFN